MKTTIKYTSLSLLTLIVPLISFGQTTPKKDLKGKQQIKRFSDLTSTVVKNDEFSEVLHTAQLLAEVSNDAYECKVFTCYNGPADPELEHCNNSTNYYISNGQFDLPPEYRLFKVGPFYAVDTAFITTGVAGTYIFTIHHRQAEKKITTVCVITFGKLTLRKK